ncbi:MAG: archaemetzincin [Flammeovirgaceae bacterium]
MAVYQANKAADSLPEFQFFHQFEAQYVVLANQIAPMPTPSAQDWLAQHQEKGQNFFQYAQQYPKIRQANHHLALIAIGSFSQEQWQTVIELGTYLEKYYPIHISYLDSIQIHELPASAVRFHRQKQELHSSLLLKQTLSKYTESFPIGVLAITPHAIFPDWQLPPVFGQASPQHKTAIISLHQLSKLTYSQNKALIDVRTFKVGSHELGHMLGFAHCLAFSCVMNGSNHLAELDRQPTWLCPDCLVKLCWRLEVNEVQRYDDLRQFWATKRNWRYKTYQDFLNISASF